MIQFAATARGKRCEVPFTQRRWPGSSTPGSPKPLHSSFTPHASAKPSSSAAVNHPKHGSDRCSVAAQPLLFSFLCFLLPPLPILPLLLAANILLPLSSLKAAATDVLPLRGVLFSFVVVLAASAAAAAASNSSSSSCDRYPAAAEQLESGGNRCPAAARRPLFFCCCAYCFRSHLRPRKAFFIFSIIQLLIGGWSALWEWIGRCATGALASTKVVV